MLLLKKVFLALVLFFSAQNSLWAQDGLSREDSLLLFQRYGELVWGSQQSSHDFFCIASNGDFVTYTLNTHEVHITAPDYSRKAVFKIKKQPDLTIITGQSQPFTFYGDTVVLNAYLSQNLFYLNPKTDTWKMKTRTYKPLFEGNAEFPILQVRQMGTKKVYMGIIFGSPSNIKRPVAQLGFTDAALTHFQAKYHIYLRRIPRINYIGYANVQAAATRQNLLVWDEFSSQILALDQDLNQTDSLKITDLRPGIDKNFVTLLQDPIGGLCYLFLKDKDHQKISIFTLECSADNKLKFRFLRTTPAFYALAVHGGSIYYGRNVHKNKGQEWGYGNLHRYVYRLKE